MASVQNILQLDNSHRNVGVTGDLYTIDHLVSDLTLDYDVPTLCGKNIDKPNILLNSREKFKTEFDKHYPYLKHINMKNLLIAGGSISNIVRGKFQRDSDIDFFIYGLDEKDATARVEEWLLDILCKKPEEPKNTDTTKKPKNDEIKYYKVIRNNNSISILLDHADLKLQIIFRLYKSISEILHGFDLGSSAVGYDGENVYFTSLGKYCHEYSCNVIDTNRRSTTYEYRLIKYFDRGFNIVVPKLNLSQLKTEYFKFGEIEICQLPYFIFGYSNIVGNKIIIKKFYNKFSNNSDYDLEPINLTNVYYQSLKINIENLINDVNYFYYVSCHIDNNNVDILTKPPRLNKGNIISFYDDVRTKLNNKNIDVHLIKKYINIDTTENIITNMFNKNINVKEYFDEIIDQQKKSALEKLEILLQKNHKINWITENPGTQLTSSFNPIIEKENKWYGEKYYKST
ncbi:ankyrin repeat protein [Cotonvirus japonicus]|uniref:Ankyrin repeat protein n=1 Tax=Cotonvirus japonicus TaxID=2811091 RepID=A0ABM7NR70_9VIRU|nr:ankyrin repeat protein [Cotonvirus japonicus]BCS82655.1 ankyrin repeat protein [Cotonvirus japonicus]